MIIVCLKILFCIATFKAYLVQLRMEVVYRLLDHLYTKDKNLNKWWMMFSKRKFMNLVLEG